jgi:hypothetical protein
MNIEDLQAELGNYLKQCDQICEITKTAHRNSKSLSGNNPYGNRFHNVVVSLTTSENKLAKGMRDVCEDEERERFLMLSEIVKSPTVKAIQKSTAIKEITMAWRSDYLNRLEGLTANPIPTTEQVVPMAVVAGTRGYIEKVALQANGCYEHGWYDACSVMIRRIVETLIIEVYEADGRPQDIKDNNGEFRMLRDLVATILADTTFNLGRDVKRSLPELKELGDRSAHKRRYNATKADIDKVLSGLRVTVEELLHLAKMK